MKTKKTKTAKKATKTAKQSQVRSKAARTHIIERGPVRPSARVSFRTVRTSEQYRACAAVSRISRLSLGIDWHVRLQVETSES